MGLDDKRFGFQNAATEFTDDIGFNIKPGGVLIGDADDFLARLVAALVRIIECLRIIFRFF